MSNPEQRQPKRYLGDSVYIEDQGFHTVLTTENGLGANNVIFLERSVLAALVEYAKLVLGTEDK